jgi:hypothetical protein
MKRLTLIGQRLCDVQRFPSQFKFKSLCRSVCRFSASIWRAQILPTHCNSLGSSGFEACELCNSKCLEALFPHYSRLLSAHTYCNHTNDYMMREETPTVWDFLLGKKYRRARLVFPSRLRLQVLVFLYLLLASDIVHNLQTYPLEGIA